MSILNQSNYLLKEGIRLSDYQDESMQQMEQQVNRVGNSVKQKAKQLAKKGGKAALKLGGKAATKGGALVAKAVWATVGSIISLGAPVLAIIAIIGALVGFIFLAEFESRPVNQNLQSESGEQMNTQQTAPDKSQGVITEISDYNLVTNAFYMNYAMNSYHRVYKGEIYSPGKSVLVTPSAKRANGDTVEATEKQELKDSSNLETKFFLSHQLLWQLDEYLHDKKFKYPESFLKPLYYEESGEGENKTFTLKDLTNDKGELVAESQVYDENGNRTTETAVGLWDYGLSPIISYKTYLKDARYEYDVTGKAYRYEYTLPEGAVLAPGQSATFSGVEAVRLTEDEAKNKYAKDDEYLPNPEFVHMIDRVMTFVGTFTPQINYNWNRDPKAVKTFVESEVDKAKSTEYDITFEKMVPKTNNHGKLIKMAKYWSGTKIGEVTDGCYKVQQYYDEEEKTGKPKKMYALYQTCGTKKVLATSQRNFRFEEILVQKTVTEKIKVTVTEEISYTKYLSKVEPRYQGEPQISDFKGNSYLQDFLYYYETYVPETAASDLDLANRVSKDPEKLQEIVDSYNSIYGKATGAIIEGDGKEVGAYSQGAYDNAYRYIEYFKKYGEMYGVDPYLLLAKAAQESSGDHDSHLTGGAAVGLMQIERPGRTDGTGVSQATAFNHQTKQSETVKVCVGNSSSPAGCLNVYQVENNIRVGAMQLAQRYEKFNGHHMLALQSYNFGEGGIRTTVRLCGLEIDQVKQDQYNLDWMSCRQTLHNNPSYVNRGDLKTYGDPVYIENVLKFYNNPETGNILTYTDRQGTVHSFDTSKISVEGTGGFLFSTTGTSGGKGLLSSVGSFFKHHFNKITSELSNLFTDIPQEFKIPDKVNTHHRPKLTETDRELMETMIFAMEEQVNLDAVGEVTDEMWKERYGAIFASHSEISSQVGDGYSGDADPYFNGMARTPLPLEMKPTFLYNFRSMIQGAHNYGVAVSAPPSTKIYAIMDGTVLKVGDAKSYKGYSVQIQHANGLVSMYSNLEEASVKVKAGDMIKKGDEIGIVTKSKDATQQFFHFELRENDIPINPTFLFENPGGGDYFIPPSSGTFTIPMLKGYVSCEWMCYPNHTGIDLGNHGDTTTPILAAADGTVAYVNPRGDGWEGGYGNYVAIDHMIDGKKYRTIYAHMHTKPLVKAGQIVKQGQKIGTMGNTGNSQGAHLHFEIQENGVREGRVNPRKYINFPGYRVPWA